MKKLKPRKLPDFDKNAEDIWKGIFAQPEYVRLPMLRSALMVSFLMGSLFDGDITNEVAPKALREITMAMRMNRLAQAANAFLKSDRSEKSAKLLKAELRQWTMVKIKKPKKA